MEKKVKDSTVVLADGSTVKVGDLYYQSNRMLLESYRKAMLYSRNSDGVVILQKILDRFEYDSCQKPGESADELFGRQFSDFVNGKMHSPKEVAKKMATEHRYLQNEMFKVCLEYIKVLAENCENGWYDPRNKYAAQTSKEIIDHFKEIDYPY